MKRVLKEGLTHLTFSHDHNDKMTRWNEYLSNVRSNKR